ncbi:hypothetical protein AB0407_22510 [Streptomyces microflavus]|uniref:hypothetical protein n=1 Tax=Streptomyces microflavus TaxID=1919 RepID=UPI0034509E96
MNIEWTDTISAAAAALSAVAAGGAWWAARRSAATAETLANIERDRRHEDLTPEIRLAITGQFGDRANILVHLAGPDSLGDLTSVELEMVNDDMDHRVLNPRLGYTQEDSDAYVWGPFRFAPGVDGADENGRRTGMMPLEMGRGRPFAIERTRPGRWMEGTTAEGWQNRYVHLPIRVRVTCKRNEETWLLARELENPPL